jgi:putative membrane protein
LGICFVIGNVSENLGIRTGFPFGRYYFTDLMGPKLFSVPILLGLAYLGMGYLSWTLARTILGGMRSPLAGFRVVTVPVVAGFIMVAWGFSMDPIWSTIEHAWIWMDGGAYFGVPTSNFLGWYLTVYLMYQLYALYLRASATTPVRTAGALSPVFWYLPVIFYGISAAGNILLAIPTASPWVVADPTGALWRVRDITHTCALVSFFLMGGFALFALARIPRQNADAHSPVYQEKRSRAK